MFPENIKGMQTSISTDCKVFFETLDGKPAVVFHVKCPDTGKIFTFVLDDATPEGISLIEDAFLLLIGLLHETNAGESRLGNWKGSAMVISKPFGNETFVTIMTPEGTSPTVKFSYGRHETQTSRLTELCKMITGYLTTGDQSVLDLQMKVYHEFHRYANVHGLSEWITMFQGPEKFQTIIQSKGGTLHLETMPATREELIRLMDERTILLAAMFYTWVCGKAVGSWKIGDLTVGGIRSPEGKPFIALSDLSFERPNNSVVIALDDEFATKVALAIQAEVDVMFNRYETEYNVLNMADPSISHFNRCLRLFKWRGEISADERVHACDHISKSIGGELVDLVIAVGDISIRQGRIKRNKKVD